MLRKAVFGKNVRCKLSQMSRYCTYENKKMTWPSFIQLFILMQINAWSYEPVRSKKQVKDNLKIEPSIKVYTNLAKSL